MEIQVAHPVVNSSDLGEAEWADQSVNSKVPELIQGLFALGFGYLWYVLILVLFNENPQYLHQGCKRMILVFANGVN